MPHDGHLYQSKREEGGPYRTEDPGLVCRSHWG